MTCADPHWTQYVAVFFTPLLALLAAVIAYRQWRLAQNKLKLDLFDRRFRIFEAAKSLIFSIISSGKASEEEVFKFLVATKEAKWLLNDDVAAYLEKSLYSKAIDLQCLQAEVEGVGAGEDRTKNIANQSSIKKWFLEQAAELEHHFSPYLRLSH